MTEDIGHARDLSNLPRSIQEELIPLLEEQKRRDESRTTVVGIVCPEKGLLRSIVKSRGKWVRTDKEPEVYIPAKLECVLKSKKRFVIVLGGRGSGKSVGIADICLILAKYDGSKTYCLREYQSSIKNSVYNLLKEEYRRLEFNGFESQASSIQMDGEDVFQFAGISRNVDSIKSAHGFKRFSVEEGQFISEESLTALTPTVRAKPKKGLPGEKLGEIEEEGSKHSLIVVANPASREDPFSKRFINPFIESLDRVGYYEDKLHLIVKMNYVDNPWFSDSELEDERLWDYENRSRAAYDHIWLAAFNDSVDDALVMTEWFDACIDAHKKLGFSARGAIKAAHDPSDQGGDSKGYAMQHGSVVMDVQEKLSGNVNEGGHWAVNLAISQSVDHFSWDCDGMGVALSEQVSHDLDGKNIVIRMFKGSESPDREKSIYKPAVSAPIQNQKTIKETFRNKRSQYYFELRDRCYRTYRAVVHGEYQDPSTLISFDSSIELLNKLRAELCRIPVNENNNGFLELYTKPDMKRKFKLPSPNLADSVMMLMRYIPSHKAEVQMPRRIRMIGER